jgi:hypothetical protein
MIPRRNSSTEGVICRHTSAPTRQIPESTKKLRKLWIRQRSRRYGDASYLLLLVQVSWNSSRSGRDCRSVSRLRRSVLTSGLELRPFQTNRSNQAKTSLDGRRLVCSGDAEADG